MSYDPYYQDPYQDMGEGDLMAMYAQMNPQLYGDDPAKRLNYYQDIMSTLGTDLIQTAGTTAPPAPQFVEPTNQTGAIYGNDQFYASIFQAIEEGANPIAAAKQAREQLGWSGTDDEFNQQVVRVATDYAGERVKNQGARAQWEAENADAIGGYSMPDGSKYKQTPLGGNDVRATASEFDLLGAPDVDQLMAQYAQSKSPSVAPGKFQSATAGVGGDGFGWQVAPPQGPGPASARAQVSVQPNANKPTQLAGGDFFANKVARDSINKRVDTAKNTQVRSDANRNLMRRITAMAGLLQGGFPE